MVAKLKDGKVLETANLGDSGYVLYHIGPDDQLEQYYQSPS